MTFNPYAPPTAIVADVINSDLDSTQPPFFAVSILKLVVMSICTFGLYETYWFYKNWKLIKARERSNIHPVLRAIFSLFYCYACFARVRDFDMPGLSKTKLAAGPLAIGWIVVSALYRLPDLYWLISMSAVVFLIPVQMYANLINISASPRHDRNTRFVGWNWAALIIGAVWLALAILGTFH